MSGRVSVSADLVQRRAAFLKTEEQWSFDLLFFSADTRCQQRPGSPRSTDFTEIHSKDLLFLDYCFSKTCSLFVKVQDVMPVVWVEPMKALTAVEPGRVNSAVTS